MSLKQLTGAPLGRPGDQVITPNNPSMDPAAAREQAAQGERVNAEDAATLDGGVPEQPAKTTKRR